MGPDPHAHQRSGCRCHSRLEVGASLDACKAEWEYARRLRRPTMPVLIEHIKIDLLPVEIARLQVVQVADFGRLVDAINHIQAIPLPDPLPEPPPIPMVWNAVHSVVYGSSVDFTAQVSVATKLIEHAQSFDLRKRKHARKLIADFLRRHDLFELTRTMLRSGIESSRLREWLVVGAVSGGLAITHVLWATGLYDLANSWLGEPRGTISLNFALAVLGGMLCYAAVRGKVRTARLDRRSAHWECWERCSTRLRSAGSSAASNGRMRWLAQRQRKTQRTALGDQCVQRIGRERSEFHSPPSSPTSETRRVRHRPGGSPPSSGPRGTCPPTAVDSPPVGNSWRRRHRPQKPALTGAELTVKRSRLSTNVSAKQCTERPMESPVHRCPRSYLMCLEHLPAGSLVMRRSGSSCRHGAKASFTHRAAISLRRSEGG